MLVAIFSGGGKWIYKKFFGETKVPDSNELTNKSVSADLVFSKGGVTPQTPQTASTTVKPPLGVSRDNAPINYPPYENYHMDPKTYFRV